MSLTLYWSLFVLFVFPPELFPEAPAALATCAQTGVVAFVFVLGAVVALAQSGRGERRSALLVAAGRRYTVAVSLVLLAAVVGALLAFRLSDQPAPSVFFWLYPLAMGFYAFSLSLRLASAAQTYLYNRLAMLVAGSLLLSFLVGIALPAVGSALGLVQTDSNFLMLMASGVVALLFPIEREGEGSRSAEEGMQPAAEDIKPSFRTSGLLLLILWGYLLGSGVFLGIHWAPVNGVWTFMGGFTAPSGSCCSAEWPFACCCDVAAATLFRGLLSCCCASPRFTAPPCSIRRLPQHAWRSSCLVGLWRWSCCGWRLSGGRATGG